MSAFVRLPECYLSSLLNIYLWLEQAASLK